MTSVSKLQVVGLHSLEGIFKALVALESKDTPPIVCARISHPSQLFQGQPLPGITCDIADQGNQI